MQFIEDTTGTKTELYFVRTKDGRELDFLTVIEDQPNTLIEVKWADGEPAEAFKHFEKFFPTIRKIQLVKALAREKTYENGLQIRQLINWLIHLDQSLTVATQ